MLIHSTANLRACAAPALSSFEHTVWQSCRVRSRVVIFVDAPQRSGHHEVMSKKVE